MNDRLTDMLRLGASAEVSETWDALEHYMHQPTGDNYTRLREAFERAVDVHEEYEREFVEYLKDETEREVKSPTRADGLGDR